MQPLLTTKFQPQRILKDYKIGNTRILIAGDSILPKEEQVKTLKRVGAIWYTAEMRKQTGTSK